MNYEPNTTQWNKGAIVVHDADYKQPRGLMRVTGYTRNGLAKCKYVSKKKPRAVYENQVMYLLDPELFGLNPEWGNYSEENLERIQTEWEQVKMWNFMFEVGQPVITTSADGGFKTVTTGRAYIDKGGNAWVRLEQGGGWALEHVTAVAPHLPKKI